MSQNVIQMRNQVQWITRQYHRLRGLGLIPVGICMLIEAAARAGWLPWYQSWQPLPYIVMWPLVGILWWRIDRYYATTFGDMQRTTKYPTHPMPAIVIAFFIYFVIMSIMFVESYFSLPVSITWILLSGVWLWLFWQSRTMYPEYPIGIRYLVSGLLMVGVGFLPLTGVVAATDVYLLTGEVGFACLGILVIINGLLDHRLLVQLLPPVQKEA